MKKIDFIKKYIRIIFIVFYITMFTGIIKSQEVSDSLFWSEDDTLTSLIDSLGKEEMVSQVNDRLDDIIQYLKTDKTIIEDDSLSGWINAIRWSVLLNEDNLLEKVSTLISYAESGDRGNWQFYFVYMALTGTYHAISQSQSEFEQVEFLFRKLDASNPIQQVFFEDRIMDLDEQALPAIISYAREGIIPYMNSLDGEKLSMEDFNFYDKYYQTVDLIINILDQKEGRSLFKELLTEKDPNAQKFARDVLGNSSE